MITIYNLLNKVKFSVNEKPADYTIAYLDRKENALKEIPYNCIRSIDKSFFTMQKDGIDVDIPLHRVKVVKKNGIVVWRREF